MPLKLKKYVDGWKDKLHDYEIVLWNEDNINIRDNDFISEAYDNEMWAFVSDYARFWALEQFGGIYFDTDVEVIRDFSPLLEDEAFAGFETDEFIAPGLVLYAKEPNNKVISATKEYYDNAVFLDENGERIKRNVCGIFTDILKEYGYSPNGRLQNCGGMVLYPKDYFCPFDDATGVLTKTVNTYSIHWYDKSWMSTERKLRNKCTRIIHRVFGSDIRQKLTGKSRA